MPHQSNRMAPKLADLQREVVTLANALGDAPREYAFRQAMQRLLDAHQRETTKAFGLGLASGALLTLMALLGSH